MPNEDRNRSQRKSRAIVKLHANARLAHATRMRVRRTGQLECLSQRARALINYLLQLELTKNRKKYPKSVGAGAGGSGEGEGGAANAGDTR